jgi:4-aminobutyrate aminotransferase
VERECLANVNRVAPLLMDGVHALQRDFAVIGDVRGLGLMIGVELVRDRATREPHPDLAHALVQRAFRKGLLLLAAGRSAIRLAPPLVIDADDVATALRILRECLTELAPGDG